MGQIRGFIRSDFSAFGAGAPNALKSDLKKPRICPIWGQSDQIWSQTYHPCFRYIAPVEGGVLIVWWAYDLISQGSGDDSGDEWWQFGQETFMVVLVQVFTFLLTLVFKHRDGSFGPGCAQFRT